MPRIAQRGRLIQGQGGSTLVELLVAMPAALLVLFACMSAFTSAGRAQQHVGERSQAIRDAQVGMERITRDVRQAEWVWFRSSTTIELGTMVRSGGATTAVERHVRYDCSLGSCRRYEGGPVGFPPPAGVVLGETDTVVDGVQNADVFRPIALDATGREVPEHLQPQALRIRLRVAQGTGAVELRDAVSLRNATRFGA